MKVIKFGGTSIANSERMMQAAKIIESEGEVLVVLSAFSGVTNLLEEIGGLFLSGKNQKAGLKIKSLANDFISYANNILTDNTLYKETKIYIDNLFRPFLTLKRNWNLTDRRQLIAIGELVSTKILHNYFLCKNVKSNLINATDLIVLDENNSPVIADIKKRFREINFEKTQAKIIITQGFICSNALGETDNLQRGGSDYSATILAAATNAEEVQIWTDIDGLRTNDPRIVDTTFPVREISYFEAAELAYFGAKILHPTCVLPAQEKNIPILLKNTLCPKNEGTLISNKSSNRELTAIAAKDNITAIKIRSGRMLNAYGFLTKIFEIFEYYKTPIDMITTSEVAVSITVDKVDNIYQIVDKLKKIGEVEVDFDQSIICIVGNFIAEKKGYASRIFNALELIPIRMISYGGSKHNVSVLVNNSHKKLALEALNNKLFKIPSYV